MEPAEPSLSRDDYRYCSLCIGESDVFIGDEEPSRFIHQLDGRIELSLDDDSKRLAIGKFSALVVDVESAINERVHPFDVFDSHSTTVVISGLPSGLLVSTDHGATWQFVQIPGVPASDLWRVQFSGTYFMLMTTQGLAISPNGKKWFIDPTMIQTLAAGTALAKIGNVIVQVPGGSTTAYSMVESATDFLLPNRRLLTPSNSGNPVALSPTYIKAL